MSGRAVCWCNPPCGLPPCTECGEDHGSHDHGAGVHLCRDCDIEYMLNDMQCSVCKRMRYRVDASDLAKHVWGERCACEPRPPSVAEVVR